ncbi:MAG: MFS transporter [Chitinophagaceae bacterium]|nr:MFS transporter [Chitinophagaceae bacterium]
MRIALILALNMQMTIVSYMVYQLTKDPLSLGMIGICEVVPAIGFSFFTGHFSDQHEKRNLKMWCIAGFMATSLIYLGLSLQSFQDIAGVKATVWFMYAVVFANGAIRAFASPANFSLMGLLVPRKHYANASTWSSTAWQTGAVLGPLLGGAIMAIADYTISYALVFVIQLLSLLAILTIPRKPLTHKPNTPMLQSLKEGLTFVFRTQVILAALALDMFAVLFGGAVALLPVYATDILQVGEVGFGWLRAAPGIGSIISLLILSVIPLNKNAGKKLLLALIGFGVSIIIFGISTNFFLSFSMLLLSGMLDAVSVVIRWTILQLYTPDAMRGRVAAVNTMFISSSNELGAAESGFTARLMGTVTAVVFGGCMTIGVVIFTWLKAPKLRQLQLNDAPDH